MCGQHVCLKQPKFSFYFCGPIRRPIVPEQAEKAVIFGVISEDWVPDSIGEEFIPLYFLFTGPKLIGERFRFFQDPIEQRQSCPNRKLHNRRGRSTSLASPRDWVSLSAQQIADPDREMAAEFRCIIQRSIARSGDRLRRPSCRPRAHVAYEQKRDHLPEREKALVQAGRRGCSEVEFQE
jgi:hypothetical protein